MDNDKKGPAPLTGWRVGDAGLTVFGPKTDAPAPRVLLTGTDRAVVRLAGAAPDLLEALVRLQATATKTTRDLQCFDGAEELDAAIDAARAAVTRAEGR